LLESFTAPKGASTYAGFSRASNDIKYFEIKGDLFAVDDLQFQSVPEPSTILGTIIPLLLLRRKYNQEENQKQ